ncbi:Coenzyme F420 hydrogenase/dehydrogenase, beta subunit C-terminal domain [Clostridium rectalis]|uniref:Coenzyme F420 hydrogenase/dehydrogenase, beta subunit C-terminal domain n=1 Tax=Clostridium rectalis TaxID=2040295 RepID=UPI000F63B071|nr:Coenzyme F420 hydrogenase/dehydrogenase, beta subunit C-terminal domain [Clostridium rectalis]
MQHAVPSITVFKKYLHSKSKGDRIIYYNFRDKEKGWLHSDVKLITENGINYQCEKTKDSFFNGFICDLYLNNSCYDCKFSSIPRVGDITIGDFWKCPDSILDEKGVSIILSNNKKGDEILNSSVKRKKVKVYKSSIKECLKGNPRITNGKLKIRRERENFLKELNNSDFNYLEKKYINKLKRNVYDED